MAPLLPGGYHMFKWILAAPGPTSKTANHKQIHPCKSQGFWFPCESPSPRTQRHLWAHWVDHRLTSTAQHWQSSPTCPHAANHHAKPSMGQQRHNASLGVTCNHIARLCGAQAVPSPPLPAPNPHTLCWAAGRTVRDDMRRSRKNCWGADRSVLLCSVPWKKGQLPMGSVCLPVTSPQGQVRVCGNTSRQELQPYFVRRTSPFSWPSLWMSFRTWVWGESLHPRKKAWNQVRLLDWEGSSRLCTGSQMPGLLGSWQESSPRKTTQKEDPN